MASHAAHTTAGGRSHARKDRQNTARRNPGAALIGEGKAIVAIGIAGIVIRPFGTGAFDEVRRHLRHHGPNTRSHLAGVERADKRANAPIDRVAHRRAIVGELLQTGVDALAPRTLGTLGRRFSRGLCARFGEASPLLCVRQR